MFRQPIQQLSASLVNRIAAGEVIERPASVVKELVENALDAGATQINLDIEDAGRALIRITDNGQGIPADELPLAFASHATSKLACDDDLTRIETMGFRGEAIASIASVSQMRICSRPPHQPLAHELTCDGGALGTVRAAAGNAGTTVEVRNLFFNTPARRKFLRGTATEYGAIADMVIRLSVPFPHVAFRLVHNGRTTLDLQATDPHQRQLMAWPAELWEQALPVERQSDEVTVRGIIGTPDLARPTAKYQLLYLNGRAIRDKALIHALREAYRGLTEPGRYPAAVLLLTMPPAEVDVNVHPTKSEVRFRDGSRLYSVVHGAVRQTLVANDLTPVAVPMSGGADDPPRQALREQLASFFKQSLPDPDAAASAAVPVSHPASPWTLQSPPPAAPPLPMGGVVAPAERQRTSLDSSMTPRAEYRPPSPREALPTTAPHAPAPQMPGGSLPAMQLHNSYLVAESDDGLIIIDQHALHERIMYEDLLNRLSRGPLESQRLLIPATCPATPGQLELLEQVQPLLARLGIEAGSFGPNTAAVQAFPSFLQRLDPANFLQELLERGEQELLDLTQEELLHGILDMMACKAAVKAGDPLSPAEIESLLARRHLVDRASNCPHGRPTTLRLTLRDLEKQFKRTGF